jgi:hypothetical protein
VLTTCQPSTVWCSRERLPAAAAQPAKVRQSCSATDKNKNKFRSFFVEGLAKPTKFLNHDSWSAGRDLKPGLPEYKANLLTTQLRISDYRNMIIDYILTDTVTNLFLCCV